MSIRNNTVDDNIVDNNRAGNNFAGNNVVGDDRFLDAARACILDVGVKRTTLTDVARRADVSRMTLYRRWPDMRALLADLMTREWLDAAAHIETASGAAPADAAPVDPAEAAYTVVAIVRALRTNPLFVKITTVDPEFLLPYLLERRGRTQDVLLGHIQERLVAGQQAGLIRAGDPVLLARSILLAAHGHALSAKTMVGGANSMTASASAETINAEAIDAEFVAMLARYLTP